MSLEKTSSIASRHRRLLKRRSRSRSPRIKENEPKESTKIYFQAEYGFWHKVIICSIIFLIYGKSINNDFTYDDTEAILENPLLLGGLEDNNNDDMKIFSPTNLQNIFQKLDYWGQEINSENSHKSYRPIATILLQIQLKIAKQTKSDPFPVFHFTSIMIHALNSCLIYDCSRKFKFSLNLAISVIFAVHPLHCESICNAANQCGLWSALFYLIGLRLVLSETKIKKISNRLIICSVLSILSKETGYFSCLSYAIIALSYHPTAVKQHNSLNLWTCGIIIPILRFLFTKTLKIFNVLDNPIPYMKYNPEKLKIILLVNLTNLKLLLTGWKSCYDWGIDDLSEFNLLYLILLLPSAVLFYHKVKKSSTVKIFVSHLVLSQLLNSHFLSLFNINAGYLVAERNHYLSVFFTICLLVEFLTEKIDQHKILALLLMAATLFGSKTSFRTVSWENDQQLFDANLNSCHSLKNQINWLHLAMDRDTMKEKGSSKFEQIYQKILVMSQDYQEIYGQNSAVLYTKARYHQQMTNDSNTAINLYNDIISSGHAQTKLLILSKRQLFTLTNNITILEPLLFLPDKLITPTEKFEIMNKIRQEKEKSTTVIDCNSFQDSSFIKIACHSIIEENDDLACQKGFKLMQTCQENISYHQSLQIAKFCRNKLDLMSNNRNLMEISDNSTSFSDNQNQSPVLDIYLKLLRTNISNSKRQSDLYTNIAAYYHLFMENTTLAEKNYRKALELNSENQIALKNWEKLRSASSGL